MRAAMDSWPSQSQPSGCLSQIPASHPGLHRRVAGPVVLLTATPPAPECLPGGAGVPILSFSGPEHPPAELHRPLRGGPSWGQGSLGWNPNSTPSKLCSFREPPPPL